MKPAHSGSGSLGPAAGTPVSPGIA